MVVAAAMDWDFQLLFQGYGPDDAFLGTNFLFSWRVSILKERGVSAVGIFCLISNFTKPIILLFLGFLPFFSICILDLRCILYRGFDLGGLHTTLCQESKGTYMCTYIKAVSPRPSSSDQFARKEELDLMSWKLTWLFTVLSFTQLAFYWPFIIDEWIHKNNSIILLF